MRRMVGQRRKQSQGNRNEIHALIGLTEEQAFY
jgi:hypothetical protein